MSKAISKDQISFIIRDLVLLNECVVVPGFGAFISNPIQVSKHPVSHLIQRPDNNVIFNSSIAMDDGLLVGELMKFSQLSFSEVKVLVNDFVLLIREELNQSRSFEIKGLGEFRQGINGQPLFRKSEELIPLESYGLKSVYAIPILREHAPVRELKEVSVISKITSDRSKNTSRRSAGLFYWIGPAVAASVFAFLYLVTPNVYDDQLVQFGIGAESVARKPLKIEMPSPINMRNARKTNQLDNDATFMFETAKFYLISASFASLENAENHINDLNNMGFNALIVDRNPSGLYRVGYSAFDNFAKANRELEAIRKSINSDAWLLVK
ncbi:MAG: SPOR domain-containing protein [Flavobacteriales bacterium]